MPVRRVFPAVFDKVLPLLQGNPHCFVLEHARGYIKTWSCWIAGAEGIEFPHAAQTGFIRREVFEISGTRVSKDEALMLTSRNARKMTAEDMSRHARNHWGAENKSHYIRDTVYREDHCQAWGGEGPQALASLRNLAIGLLRLKGVKAVKETTELIACGITASVPTDLAAYLPHLAACGRLRADHRGHAGVGDDGRHVCTGGPWGPPVQTCSKARRRRRGPRFRITGTRS